MNTVLLLIGLFLLAGLVVFWHTTSAARQVEASKIEAHKWYHYRVEKANQHNRSALGWIVVIIIVGGLAVLAAWVYI